MSQETSRTLFSEDAEHDAELSGDDSDDTLESLRKDDLALATFLEALTGDPAPKEIIKQAFRSFVRARVAGGAKPAEAKSEAFEVLEMFRGAVKVEKDAG